MHNLRNALAVAAVAALSAAFGAPVEAQVSCNAIITEKATMTADLNCGMVTPAFTVDGGAVDMDGYKVTTCSGCTGVTLTGKGSKLSNGTIIHGGGLGYGVYMSGVGKHQVENVVVTGAWEGFYAAVDGNKLRNCVAINGSNYGFELNSNGNSLTRCHVGGGTRGYRVNGSNNTLTENTAANITNAAFQIIGAKANRNHAVDSGEGFWVPGDNNLLAGNVAAGNTNYGFEVGGAFTQGQKLKKNVAIDSGLGIQFYSDNSQLANGLTSDNANGGIAVLGSNNKVNGCSAFNNNATGLRIGPSSSTNNLGSNLSMGNFGHGVNAQGGSTTNAISKTVALGNNAFDLNDENGNCGGNVWSDSIFGDRSAGGVADHACIE